MHRLCNVALVTTLLPWVPPNDSGLSLPAEFDERALANVLLLSATLLFWFAALQWARRPAVLRDYEAVVDTKPPGSALSAALLLSGPTPGPTRNAVGQSQHSALGEYLRRREMGNESQNTLGQSLLGEGGNGSEFAGRTATDCTGELRSPEAVRQERAITALWFAKGLLDSVPGVALRQFVLQELQASPASQAVIFSVRMDLLLLPLTTVHNAHCQVSAVQHENRAFCHRWSRCCLGT